MTSWAPVSFVLPSITMSGLLIHGQFNQLLWTCHVIVQSSLTRIVAHIYSTALVVLNSSPHLIASSWWIVLATWLWRWVWSPWAGVWHSSEICWTGCCCCCYYYYYYYYYYYCYWLMLINDSSVLLSPGLLCQHDNKHTMNWIERTELVLTQYHGQNPTSKCFKTWYIIIKILQYWMVSTYIYIYIYRV